MDHEAGDHETGRAARVEPQTLAFLQALETQQHPSFHTLTPTDARNLLRQIQMNGQVAKPPVAFEERIIHAGPTGTIALHIVRSPASTGNLQRQGPKLIFQVLFYPVTDAELDNASYHQFGGGAYWLTRADMA